MPYKLADKAILQLNKLAVQRFSKVTDFDDLNVIQEIRTLYQNLDRDNRHKFIELYMEKYKQVREDILEELLEMELAGLLDDETETLLDRLFGKRRTELKEPKEEKIAEIMRESAEIPEAEAVAKVDEILGDPNEVTHYAYDAEVPRKRDRLTEAINSTAGVSGKKAELKKGLKYWSRMTGWYADIVSDDANITALEDSGVEYVKWNTQGDEKVCKECRERDQQIYPIHNIPPKPHPNCRCYMTRYGKRN